MVFCCIAIVAIAIVYFFGLWIRQLFLGRRRDAEYASWPPPPRALAGNGAWPVYGHTRLFRRHVGDVALRFDSQWKEFGPFSQRQLGDCFAIFIWGQWRIGIQGSERAQQFFQHQTLHEGWPWTPPVTLLGKSCLAFLQQDDPAQAEGLRGLLRTPLCANSIQRFAPQFAKAAEQCLTAVEQGLFCKANLRTPKKQQRNNKRNDCASPLSCNDDDLLDEEDLEEGVCCKLKWDALRSYSLDLCDGPLFQMNLWKGNDDDDDDKTTSAKTSSNEQTYGPSTEKERTKQVNPSNSMFAELTKPKHCKSEEPPSRELMLLWMERIKLGLDVIKLTFGPEWMYVWMFNEYGRAVNARMYVEKLVGEQVERMVALVPQVTHERGHVYHEPTTQPFPLLAMHQNLMRSKEGIFGDFSVYPTTTTITAAGTVEEPSKNRMRCNSMPNRSACVAEISPPPTDEECFASPYVQPFKTEQDLARPSPTRRRVTIPRDNFLPEGNLVEEQLGLKQKTHLHESHQSAPLGKGCWSTPPVPCCESKISLSPPLGDHDESSSVNLATTLKTVAMEIETNFLRGSSQQTMPPNGAKKTHQKKSVDEVFSKIKANRDKQKHLSEENQVVYSFFNPAKREPSVDAAASASVIKVIKTMPETKLMGTKQRHVGLVPCEPEKNEIAEEHFKKTSLQPIRRPTNVASTPMKTCTTPQTPMSSSCRQHTNMRNTFVGKKKVAPDPCNANVCSLLEALLQQRGPEGKGISQTTLTELIINLWMMLEVGNAWTAMALNLLAWDETALGVIQEELDVLEMEFGNELFSPEALDRMKYLDALIYESIRLIPPFLGGLKSTTETVILKDAGVQIPKGSHIFFCQPSRQEFDLFAAVGKRPECLGQKYPCVELFGFLPLQGLEVPLMVLQCKVFLIVTLRNNAPTVSKRNTFIRRVKSAVSFRKIQNAETPEASLHSLVGLADVGDGESGSNCSNGAWDLEDGAVGHSAHKMTPSEAMKRFTKIPFPEPKRVIRLTPRGL